MDPQMSSVLAGRVAIERLDTTDHHAHPHTRRRSRFLAGIGRVLVSPVTTAIASRRTHARGEIAHPLDRRSNSAG